MSTKLETFLSKLGSPGRYQVVTVVSILVPYTCMIAVNYALNIIVAIPDHRCKILDGETWQLNDTIPTTINEKGKVEYQHCKMYIDAANHSKGVQSCPDGYQFLMEPGRSTVATEWELVCSNLYLGRLYQSTHYAGVVIGGCLAGYLSDRFGRKVVYVVSLFGQAGLMVVIYFVRSFVAVTALSFFRGLCSQAVMTIGMILAMEVVAARYRPWVGVTVSSSGAVGLALAALCGQFLPNWRQCSLAVVAATTLSMATVWSIPESLRWLLTRGKTEAAMKLVKRTSRWNKIKFSRNGALELHDIADEIQKARPNVGLRAIWQLLKSSKLRTYTLVLFTSSTMGQIASYGNVYSLDLLSGNKFTNMYIMAAVDMASRPFMYIPITRIGRRISLVTSHGIVATTSILCAVLGHFAKDSSPVYGHIAVALAILGKVGISLFWSAFHLIVTELFPTSARTTASGTINAVGRLGLFILPLILLLGDYYWKFLPFVVYGLGNLIAAVLSFLLPETKDKPMPDTVIAAETMASPRQSADNSSAVSKILKDVVE